MKLRFDPEKHIYTLGDRRLPSVTEIVNSVCGVEYYADEFYLNKGSQVHKCIALYLGGRLDDSSVDLRIRGRVDQAKKVIRELRINPSLIEVSMAHPVLGYAGTPDLLAGNVLIDWKSSHTKEGGVQAGGYVELLEANKYSVKECYEIVLEDDRYIVFEHQPKRSRRLFLAAKIIYDWRQNGRD